MNILEVLQFILLIVVVGVNGILALLVFKNNPRSATNRIYSLLSIVISIWLIINYLSIHQSFTGSSLLIIRLTIFFATPLTLLFFLFTHTLPKITLGLNRRVFILLITLTGAVMFITISPYTFSGIEIINGSPNPIPGPGLLPFSLLTTFFSLASIYILIKRLRNSKGTERIQLRYILFGIFAMLILTIITILIPVVAFKYNKFVSLIPLYTSIFLGTATYAIIKHRLMDIRAVVARAVSYILVIGLFGLVYGLIFALTSAFLVGTSAGSRTIAVSTVLALLMAFSFQSFQRFLEKVTDKVFYRNKYDVDKLLYDFALMMASTLRLEDLTHQILQELLRQVRITRGAFILVEDEHIYEVAHEGYAEAPEVDEQEILKFLGQNKTLIFEELPEDDIKELMRSMEFIVVVPLITEGKYIGLLALGEKLSGDIYTSEDIRVIEILAPEAAVAIQNAKAYEEISRFNITLQEEVNKATKDLQAANTKLKQLDELKDDFVSVASHELRTPMTAIKSYLWLALKKPDAPLSEKMNRYLGRAYISTERLINLVNDMLNVSRIEAGRIEIRPSAFGMEQLVDDVAGEVSAKVAEKSIKLNILKENIPQVFADVDKVHQVLLNLIGNSLKFTPEEGTITLSFFPDGKMLEVSVKDSGVGMSKDDVSRLFQKFGRLDSSYVAAATSGGTGLGLFISKNLVELMGGKIWAASEGTGKGSTFTFSLPIATPENMAQAEKYTKKVADGEAKMLEPAAI